MKAKIFLGPVDVANISNSFNSLFKELEIKADYYTFSNINQSFGFGSGKQIKQFDYKLRIFGKNIISIINLFIKYFFLAYTLLKYNTYIFISPHTIISRKKEKKILKYFNKKIIFLFVGCIDRDIGFLKDDPKYICNRCTDNAKKKFCLCSMPQQKRNRIQEYEKHSDYIISQDDSAGYLLNKKHIWFHLFTDKPKGIDYLKKHDNSKIIISHFPSNPEIKLSNIIIPILEELQKNHKNIEVIIKSKIPHKEVLSFLEETHIVIDALGLSYGMLAIEAMARGCVVVAGDFDFIRNKIPDIAVIGATSLNLYAKIEELIIDKALLIEKAKKSISYFNKYHSFDAAGKYYKEKLDI